MTSLLLYDKEPPPVVVLPPNTVLKYDPLPDRWIPASWGWLWRLRDSLYGKRAGVNIDAQILKLSGAALDLSQLPKPTFTTNTLMIWLVPTAECDRIKHILRSASGTELASRPRISTADGIVAQLFSGNRMPLQGGAVDVGLSFQVLPKTTKHKTDLTFAIKLTELTEREGEPVLKTNILESIRVQLPIGHGVVLLQPAVERRPGLGMVLSVGRN